MGVAEPIRRYTPAEYYERERAAIEKSDYYRGEIFMMAGGMERHSLICTNVAGALWQRLRGKPCVAFESNLRLKIVATGLRTYPDVSVYCGLRESDPEDPSGETKTNPTVVFEVLSPTTEAYDRGVKAVHYRRIESLGAHVMVAQDQPHVEVYERQGDGGWVLREYDGMEAVVKLGAIGVELPMGEIYERVEFGKQETPQADGGQGNRV